MRRAVILLAICSVGRTATAAELLKVPTRLEPVQAGVTMALENDLFSLAKKTDRWYTNGIHFAWHYKPEEQPFGAEQLQQFGRRLFRLEDCPESPGPEPERCNITITYGIGQNMYSPRVIDDPNPQPDDRPWAGWLYGGVGVAHVSGNRHQIAAVKLGPTGPLSFAEEAQTYVHRYVSNSPKPLGWGNQLRPRLGVQLSYLSTHFVNIGRTFVGNASWGGTLGNLRTMGRIGAGLTWSLAPDELKRFQAGTLDEGEFLIPDYSNSDTGIVQSLRRTVFYANVQVAAVAHNTFIQGDTYAGRSQIDLVRNVTTTTLGVSVPLPLGARDRWKLGFAYKVRSPEFRARGFASDDSYQRWGVVSLSWINN